MDPHHEVEREGAERLRANVAFQDAIARAGREAMEKHGLDEDACVAELCIELQDEGLLQESVEQASHIHGLSQQDISKYLARPQK